MKRLFAILFFVFLLTVTMVIGTSAAKVVDSGKCGDNLTWEFTDDGKLTICGNGAMYSYGSSTSGINITTAPWGHIVIK